MFIWEMFKMGLKLSLPELARKTMESKLENKEFEPNDITKEKYSKNKASFVTLSTRQGKLRGCIGSLKPRKELWKDVQENAVNAMHDPRFPPLKKKELENVRIEVSVLSKPKRLDYKTPEELIKKLKKYMGIILKKGFNSSTFLPQVWEQIQDKQEFLEHLSIKAGLDKNAWKDEETEIWYYTVMKEKESKK
ncbi:AmmeMemoRadiSam system protein A [Candidatus Pacearchaeota archaeon]|nr:AmmeMemoRadiSam system protein A [Candidatus Pacearchaeota archaeon]